MLARRREQIYLVLGHIGVNILLGWLLARLWKDYRRRVEWLYVSAPAEPLSTPAASPTYKGGTPQSFVEIVDRNVFSPLRGVQPPQPVEAPKAPPLPLLFGTMNLGNGRFAVMAPGGQATAGSKQVLLGEEIGGYKLVSVNTSTVVVQWQDTKTTLEISSPTSRVPGMIEKTVSASVHQAPITTVGSVPGRSTAAPTPFGGAAINSAARTPGSDVPPGTVINGKKKVLLPTPFGVKTLWVDVGTTGTESTNQATGPNK